MRYRPFTLSRFPRETPDPDGGQRWGVDEEEIPVVTWRSRRAVLGTACLTVLGGWGAYRVLAVGHAVFSSDKSAVLWSLLFLLAAHQLVIAWTDRPFTVTEQQERELDRIPVIVNVPLYNEDADVVRRVIGSIMRQTRAPQIVYVIDDGSTSPNADYEPIRRYWLRHTPPEIELRWERQDNTGKRGAQARTFREVPDGALVVTLDSDTTMTRTYLEELIKPFADPRVMSVAGVELAYNAHANVWTRMASLRQLSWQLITCCAQSRLGQVTVNRGTGAMYRSEVVRDYLSGYLGERFAGREVRYSDDSLLTLYALMRGRTVQQLSAFQLAMYPEFVGHQIRQWKRWMRGSTIRSIWRARYLPVRSYAWWMNAGVWWQFFASYGAYLWVFVILPAEGRFSVIPVTMGLLVSFLQNLRNLLIRRSDETPRQQVDMLLWAPVSWLYSALVLRPLRLWSMATCRNNTWGTRARIEVGISALREAEIRWSEDRPAGLPGQRGEAVPVGVPAAGDEEERVTQRLPRVRPGVGSEYWMPEES